MGVGILAKRVVLELGSSTNFVYSLKGVGNTYSFFIIKFVRRMPWRFTVCLAAT